MEQNSEQVKMGEVLHDASFRRNVKNRIINNTIAIDFIEDGHTVHEVKSSQAMEHASLGQLKFYLWYLELMGMPGVKGELHYPATRQKRSVLLTPEDKDELQRIVGDIFPILALPKPPLAQKSRLCKKCAYYELCFA